MLLSLVVALCLVACNSIDKQFLITENSVGLLTKDTTTDKLDTLYTNDSLTKTTLEGEFRYASSERFFVFEKKGEKKQLLELTPSSSKENENQYITSVEVLDPRFKTEKHISLTSPFSEIKKVYQEFEIQTSLMSVNVTPKGSSLCFVYDRNQLMTSNSGEYTANDIPNDALMKRMMITWVR